jgi:acetolactate synthase-1/2/3 large subunit
VALKSDAFAPRAKIVHMDIDPSEFDKNVICDLAVSGDLKATLGGLMPLIEEHDRSSWQAEIDNWRATDATLAQRRSGFFPQAIMEIIGEEAGSEAVIVTDVGQHQMWAAQFCKQTHPRGFLTSGGLGTMGFGLGAAIGAKLALGDKVTVIHITGDASFHMNMQETCTAVSENLQIITVLMDNRTLGMVRQLQHYFQNSHYIATEPDRKTDFVMLENAFGGTGFHAENADEFRAALRKAMETDGPSLIHCPIGAEELVLPMIASGKTVSDIILEE